jgi:hypothetical protein
MLLPEAVAELHDPLQTADCKDTHRRTDRLPKEDGRPGNPTKPELEDRRGREPPALHVEEGTTRSRTSNPTVNLADANPGKGDNVWVEHRAGRAGHGEKQPFWNKLSEAWFPGAPTDPDIARVRLRITRADHGDAKESRIVQMFELPGGLLDRQASR